MAARLVTFQLSLHEAMANGLFPPSSTVSVRGDFTQWEPIYFLLDNDGDGIYSVAVPITGNAGDVVRFKYVLSVSGQDVWEALPEREYTLGPADVNATASLQPHIFETLRHGWFHASKATYIDPLYLGCWILGLWLVGLLLLSVVRGRIQMP